MNEERNSGIRIIQPDSKTLRKFVGHSFESVINSENDTSYYPKSSTGTITDEESERSSIKENDNLSLEYSSHWTVEYSSTEPSDTEDEEFKQKFEQYKKHLLEDDEGIAASCEEENSFVMEHYMKEMVVMSAEDKRSLMIAAKEKDRNTSITYSYGEDTSYIMNTETFDENFESMSLSIDTQEGSYHAESYEDSCTRHNQSSNDHDDTLLYKVPYNGQDVNEKVNELSLENGSNNDGKDVETNEDLFNKNTEEITGTENLDNLDSSFIINEHTKEGNEISCKENLQNLHGQITEKCEENASKNHISYNKVGLRRGKTSSDVEDISQEESFVSLDEVVNKNSLEIENITKILENFPVKGDSMVTEDAENSFTEKIPLENDIKINEDDTELRTLEFSGEKENEIREYGEEIVNEFHSEKNYEVNKETEGINLHAEVANQIEDDRCSEDGYLKGNNKSKEEFIEDEVITKDLTPNENDSFLEKCESDESNGQCEQSEMHDSGVTIHEEDSVETSNLDTQISVKYQKSHSVVSLKNDDENTDDLDSYVSHSGSLHYKDDMPDEINENNSVAEEDFEKTEHEDSFKKDRTKSNEIILSQDEDIYGDNDIEIINDEQTKPMDSASYKYDTVKDHHDMNVTDHEKSDKEISTLKANTHINKKSHSADENRNTKHLLKVLSLTDTQPFEDTDMMHDNLLEIVDADGWNMLHLAASKGLDNFLKKLLRHGLSTEDLTDSNHTALQLAIMNNNLKCCKILLKHGASFETKEGLLDEDFIETVSGVSPGIKDLLENYKHNYIKVQKLSEILNEFSSEKKDLSKHLPTSLLPILADITTEDDESDGNHLQQQSTD